MVPRVFGKQEVNRRGITRESEPSLNYINHSKDDSIIMELIIISSRSKNIFIENKIKVTKIN